ncbi:protein KTI12 homolog isoform X2 [Lepeophtheirus salmonis]|uniref:protein KTI12 homolog isoform X2 n=1 Tax=Lepeophtheirus salmonis TaxID=72036 RepID=UPI001AE54DE1|nr:protein KTI12 homolog isoform X2 [Lepeophtheirus salmonis]
MPLIIITGIPSSGKTTTAHKLRDFFEGEKGKKVMIVSELNDQTPQRNDIYKDSAVEKTVRSAFKSEILRILNKEDIIIADGSNYIKGFRYELYCATKSYKTPQITVHCDVSPSDTKEFNASKESEDSKYSEEIIDALVMRYEAPIYYNRWENPLFLSIKETFHLKICTPLSTKGNLLHLINPLSANLCRIQILYMSSIALRGKLTIPLCNFCEIRERESLKSPQVLK